MSILNERGWAASESQMLMTERSSFPLALGPAVLDPALYDSDLGGCGDREEMTGIVFFFVVIGSLTFRWPFSGYLVPNLSFERYLKGPPSTNTALHGYVPMRPEKNKRWTSQLPSSSSRFSMLAKTKLESST